MSNLHHGHARRGALSKEYRAWRSMLARCHNPAATAYDRYGGAGILVCKRWHTFVNFLADMGKCPKGGTLDRINGKKGYKPSNCRWASSAEQNRNKSSNLWFTYKGKTRCLSDWANLKGMQQQTLYARLIVYKWPIKKALETPVRFRTKY